MKMLRGNNGDDLFAFLANSGADLIEYFVAGAGSDDVIQLLSINGFDDFTDVELAANQVGNATLIDLGAGNQITLLGVQEVQLHADDFLFT
jgi:hypothetical protein